VADIDKSPDTQQRDPLIFSVPTEEAESVDPNVSPHQNASYVMCPDALGSLDALVNPPLAHPAPAAASAAKGKELALPTRAHQPSGALYRGDASVASQYLLLMVPASQSDRQQQTLPGNGSAADADDGWIEVGCQVLSVRHVRGVNVSSPEGVPVALQPQVASLLA
jgi:hypothetical protein